MRNFINIYSAWLAICLECVKVHRRVWARSTEALAMIKKMGYSMKGGQLNKQNIINN